MDLSLLSFLDLPRVLTIAVLVGGIVRGLKPYVSLPEKGWPWVAVALGAAASLAMGYAQLSLATALVLVVEGIAGGWGAIAGHESLKAMLGDKATKVLGTSKGGAAER